MIAVEHSANDLKHRRMTLRHTHGVIANKRLLTSGCNIKILEIVQTRIQNAEIVPLKEIHALLR